MNHLNVRTKEKKKACMKIAEISLSASYSITSLVRASVVRGPFVVRGFEWQNFSSQ